MFEEKDDLGERSPYKVKLEVFEGPLDLLLHLIQKNEINIFDIPIALITEQYLDYLRWMKVLNLDIAGEYLLMASTLLHIKSKMLLPNPSKDEEEEEEDPRAELVRKLLEYQKYKNAALALDQRPRLDRDVFIRLKTEESLKEPEEKLEVSLYELVEAFRRVLKRMKPEKFHEIILEPINVEDRMEEILSILKKENRSLAFHHLFPEGSSLRLIIVTFLAVLELVKMGFIRVFQASAFETIRISPI